MSYKRQKSETTKTYDAFLNYVQLGDNRSLESLSSNLNLPVKTLKKWSEKWDWEKRLSNNDNTKNEPENKEKITDNKKVKVKSEINLENLYATIQDVIKRINEKLDENKEQLDQLSFEQLMKHIQNLLKLFNEFMKTVKSGNVFKEVQKDKFRINMFEKIRTDENLYKLTDEILLILAGD